ncbi:Pr6Pr family membrane protein [Nocardioides sp. Root140]|uniref:Pr6Pr family membrane protein n=1 Tax=Nocardioides sp. Root140 TaxID=1736460 RepID=UPI0006F91AC9|nr:Pr6Pr family membrane protein [Nocardioides sp. Root140]KQY63576.1 hypothetical protein ASD30_00750 [Nocardioides sp. Root140]
MAATSDRSASAWHLLTAVVTTAALVLQLVLIVQGNAVLDETEQPDLGTRLIRFVSYLTIWSNALVAWSSATLVRDPFRDGGPAWRALRLNAVVLCLGGGIVHFFLLRPILDLHGADWLADKLLHVVVPLLATIGWLAFGPRGRIGRLVPFLVLPVFWLVYTLVRGPFANWYPYPFIDVDEHGYAVVLANCAGVTVLMLALFAGALWLDRRLPVRAAQEREPAQR